MRDSVEYKQRVDEYNNNIVGYSVPYVCFNCREIVKEPGSGCRYCHYSFCE